MDKVYIQINFGHRSFTTGKTAIIAIDQSSTNFELIEEYFHLAKQKLCEKINMKEDEISVFDCCYLGPGVIFVD